MKPFNKLLTGTLMLCFSSAVFSQITTDTTFATQMNNAFANLDKSRVPYGILRDYGMEFTDLNVFNGTASLVDSNRVDAPAFWDVYNTLLMGIIYNSASGFLRPDTINNRWYNHRQGGQITLAGLYFNYSRFRDDAYPNYITITNSQLYDKFVNGVWQNPYVSQPAFVLAPSVTEYKGQSFSLLLPSDIWFTNSASSISSISVDVSDGNGYRIITPGIPLSDTGYKEWTYKLTLTNSSNLYAHSNVHISQSVNSGGGSGSLAPNGYSGGTITITATKAFQGVRGTANVTVNYANADLKFRKPLIVVEGFDPWKILNPENPTGFTNINTFQASIDNSNSFNLESLLGTGLNQYDIVYVDWNNGTDYLERNAYVLESVIDWVNTKKATDGSTQPNVVWGQSMGGVITRYALKDMENTGDHHQVRLFISHGLTTIALDLGSLTSGIYTMQVYNGAEWSSQQFVKQ